MKRSCHFINVLVVVSLVLEGAAAWASEPPPGTTYTWDAEGGATTTWSMDLNSNLNWVGDVVPVFAAGDTFDLSTVTLAAAGVSTVDSSATLGVINIGDVGGAYSWTLDSTGGAGIALDNGLSNSQINQTAESFGDTISAALSLAGSLDITNSAEAKALTISTGGITSSAISGVQTISNLGSAAGGVTISGVVGDGVSGGKVAVTQDAVGTLTLSGPNTYTGGTIINAGILRAGSATAFGPATDASLTFGPDSTGTVQLNGNSMTVVGLHTDPTMPGTTYVENNSATAATLTINNATDNTFAGVFQKGAGGNLALTKIGAGKLTLTGNSGTSIGGDVRVNAGSMEISGGGKLANGAGSIGFAVADTGAVTVTGDGSQWNSTTTLRVGESGSNNSLTISDGGKVTANKTGTVSNLCIGYNTGANNNTITVTGEGSNIFVGGWGYLEVGRLSSGNSLIIQDGGTVTCDLFWTSGGSGNPNGASNSTITVTGSDSTFTANGNYDIADRGTDNHFNVLDGATANTVGFGYVGWYTGNVAILVDGSGSVWTTGGMDWGNGGSNAIATISHGGRWNSGGVNVKNANAINLNSGGELNIDTLTLAAAARLNFDGGRLIAKSAGSLVNGSGQINLIGAGYISTDYAKTIGNVIYGDGSLTKEGIGALTLTNANTYGGGTIVDGGTLLVNNTVNSGTGTGGVTVKDTGTLGGTGTVAGLVTVNDGGTLLGIGTMAGGVVVNAGGHLAPGVGVGTLHAGTSVTMAADAIYNWEFDGTNADKVVITGSLQLDSGWKVVLAGAITPAFSTQYDLFTYNPGSFTGSLAAVIDYSGVTGWPVSWIGQDDGAGKIYIAFGPKPGDADGNGIVDAADYIWMKLHFGDATANGTNGDFNGNGTVDWSDLQMLMTAMAAAPPVQTPEPATLGLLALGALAVLRRRRAKP